MDVIKVRTSLASVEFPRGNVWGTNKVDLLIGRNGSGKTEILTALTGLARSPKIPNDVHVTWRSEGNIASTDWGSHYNRPPPSHVVAQTFSPFTRFPKSAESDLSLSSIYMDGEEVDLHYQCIGLHRSFQSIGLSLSRRTLESSIYRLSEMPERFSRAFKVMGNLGFKEEFTLTYEITSQLTGLIAHGYNNDLAIRVVDYFKDAKGGVANEVRRTDSGRLVELLLEAFRLLYEDLQQYSHFTRRFGGHGFRDINDFAVLQSLALLRRLRLLNLRSFEVTKEDGKRFGIAGASSGQQQMLCSIIGLTSALKDESLILIDEPELSLHPSWQQLYLEYLQAALEPFRRCHVVIATHSPLIVQRGNGLGIAPTRMDEGVTPLPDTSDPDHITATSVEGTLLDVFETPLSDSVELANEIFAAITSAEAGGERERSAALKSLERLRQIYSGPEVRDTKTQELIQEAVTFLEQGAN